MSNIIGSPFDNFVTNQINRRQIALGTRSSISNSSLRYYTTKTPWLRLASSINVENLKIGKDEDGKNIIDPNSVYQKLLKVGFNQHQIKGPNLSRNLILQGGVVSVNQDHSEEQNQDIVFRGPKSGLTSSTNSLDGAYGFGGINERGYVPMPGITSATTQYYNNGALSKATVNIKCYSRAQFALLDALYLRPGYTLLLEFGWSVYLENSFGEVTSFPSFNTAPLDFILNPNLFSKMSPDQYSMLTLIQEERANYSGNYEAVYGKVTNFKWSFSKEGVYDCSVDIIGVGSVLESLKLNVVTPRKSTQSNTKDGTTAEPNPTYNEWRADYLKSVPVFLRALEADWPSFLHYPDQAFKQAKRVKIIKSLVTSPTGNKEKDAKTYQAVKDKIRNKYDKYIEGLENNKEINLQNNNNNPLIANKNTTVLNSYFYNAYQKLLAVENNDTDIKFSGTTLGMENAGCSIDRTYNGELPIPGQGPSSTSGFIKFGYLLQIIEENCNLFSSVDEGVPLMKFDFSYTNMEDDDNYMAIFPPNLSSNPQKCIVPYTKASIEGVLGKEYYTTPAGQHDLKTDTDVNKSLTNNTGFLVDENPYIGRIGNVMINLRFAAQSLAEAPKDEDGGVAVISYLKTILEGINSSMGSINNFMVVNDETSGFIKIYDESPMPDITPIPEEKFAVLNIFGVKKGPSGDKNNVNIYDVSNVTGSFITNVGLDAEIPQNFSTLVSIGSQINGSNLQGNSYSFSSYNRGLVDRIIPEKKSTKKKEKGRKQTALDLFKSKIYYGSLGDKISPFASTYLTTDDGLYNGDSYNFDPSVTADFTENYTTYLKLIQGITAESNLIPKPFFLPFNLNLEMEGLSGMRLFEKFRITDDILPPSYDNNSIDIIVKGINHNIDVQSWKTTVDTISVPRFDPVIIPTPSGSIEETEKNETQQKVENANSKKVVDPEEDKILRLRLTRLNDDGYQTFGLMEVLDNNGDLLYALATVELPWRDNQNGNSCIPLGTYDLAYRNSPEHGDCFIIVDEGTPQTGNVDEPYKGGFGIYGNQNNTARGLVLIHKATAARFNDGRNILKGCIAPGLHFNTNQNIDNKGKSDKSGNPRGLGPQHGTPYKSKSGVDTLAAVAQLLGTLKETGINPGFKMEITALNPENGKSKWEWFYDFEPQEFIAEIEAKTGAKYTYLT